MRKRGRLSALRRIHVTVDIAGSNPAALTHLPVPQAPTSLTGSDRAFGEWGRQTYFHAPPSGCQYRQNPLLAAHRENLPVCKL